MPRYITKSLYVDYQNFPKLAWWRWNNIDIYKKIKKIDTEESADLAMELWKTVEKLVWEYFVVKTSKTILDLFPDNPEIDKDREDDDDTWVEKSFDERISENIRNTREAIINKKPFIYQPGFLYWRCYVRADYLLLNGTWTYDLIEVKAKSHIRKNAKNNWEDEDIGSIESIFLDDVSFQKYIINSVFSEWDLPDLWAIYIAHLNSKYVRSWAISVSEIIKLEKVWAITEFPVFQRNKETTIQRDDSISSPTVVQERISMISMECILPETEFNSLHSFSGAKYFEYFGNEKPSGTIYSPRFVSAPVVAEFHYKWVISIEDIPVEDIPRFWNKASEFIEKYLASHTYPVINKAEISTRLSELRFPICFYDYETVSMPLPPMDGTSPYQQVVVQYSLHKVYEDWSIRHYGSILSEESDVFNISEIPEINTEGYSFQVNRSVKGSQEEFLKLFLEDIGSDIDSSFVVWYDPFENSRNKEIWIRYPNLENSFLTINQNTFDLYRLFAEYHYFDRAFRWSASIKKVLPVLVPELSYEWLLIGKWDQAMRALWDIINGHNSEPESRKETLKNLLIYCRQDSYAMFVIYKRLLELL